MPLGIEGLSIFISLKISAKLLGQLVIKKDILINGINRMDLIDAQPRSLIKLVMLRCYIS